MTIEIEHHDRNDNELPTTEEIIEQLQNWDRSHVDDADRIIEVEGDIEIKHRACDGHVILRYELAMGWKMDCEVGGLEGRMMSSDELQPMTTTMIRYN